MGVDVAGGGFVHTDRERFYSYRRDLNTGENGDLDLVGVAGDAVYSWCLLWCLARSEGDLVLSAFAFASVAACLANACLSAYSARIFRLRAELLSIYKTSDRGMTQ